MPEQENDRVELQVTDTEARAPVRLTSGRRYVLVLGGSSKLTVCVVNCRDEPVPDLLCRLILPDETEQNLITDADGLVAEELSGEIETVELVLPDISVESEAGGSQEQSGSGSVFRYRGEPLTLQNRERSKVKLLPRVFCARLIGTLFDTSKCFMLPEGLTSIQSVKYYYDEHPSLSVLVVGHTDTTGSHAYNLPLSEERAAAVAAYLKDDVDHWLDWYGAGKPQDKRWGTIEDKHMLQSLTDGSTPFYVGRIDTVNWDQNTKNAVKRFQEWSNKERGSGLDVDGICGENTRRALITEYMNKDDTSLPPEAELQTHGCGEHHPATQTGDSVEEQENRRVEVFLFEEEIVPPPPASCPSPEGCTEYLAWLALVTETIDLREDPAQLDRVAWERPEE